MEVVIDANNLFSALIKNSKTAELLFEKLLIIYAPDFIIEEFLKYQDEILLKTHRTKEEFILIMHQLKEIITIVPKEDYSNFIDEGKIISPDEKDIMYFALALKLKCAIWSNDKALKEQDKIIVYNTTDLINLL